MVTATGQTNPYAEHPAVQAPANGSPYSALPQELKLHIFGFLNDPKDILNAGAACREDNAISKDDRLWSALIPEKDGFICVRSNFEYRAKEKAKKQARDKFVAASVAEMVALVPESNREVFGEERVRSVVNKYVNARIGIGYGDDDWDKNKRHEDKRSAHYELVAMMAYQPGGIDIESEETEDKFTQINAKIKRWSKSVKQLNINNDFIKTQEEAVSSFEKSSGYEKYKLFTSLQKEKWTLSEPSEEEKNNESCHGLYWAQ